MTCEGTQRVVSADGRARVRVRGFGLCIRTVAVPAPVDRVAVAGKAAELAGAKADSAAAATEVAGCLAGTRGRAPRGAEEATVGWVVEKRHMDLET